MGEAIITRRGIKSTRGTMPEFTYSGAYIFIDDGKVDGVQNWRIKFLSSGTLIFTKVVKNIDVFLVGGGGGTRPYSGGGGSGRTYTQKMLPVERGVEYEIVVGGGGTAAESYGGLSGGTGGTTTAFGCSADGGFGGVQNTNSNDGVGGIGGSGGGGYNGGKGGIDGADGTNGTLTNEDESLRIIAGGQGLDDITREFWEPNGQLYASGGDSWFGDYVTPQDAAANTGDGAPGYACNGGSGIVVIRNAR